MRDKLAKKLALITLAATSLIVLTGLPTTVLAATSSSQDAGQALEIAPPIITLKVNPGQVVKTTIQLRDVSKAKLLVTNQVNDFVAAGEDGTPKILMGEDNGNPFSLKNWVAPISPLTLSPQQIKKIPVTINVPKSASPGGHYGVIRFTGTAPNLSDSGASKVGLSASLGALVLLTVNGKLKHDLAVQEFSVNNGGKAGSFFQSTPLNFVVRLKNNGNVQEEPTGQIVITDMFGHTTAGVNVNNPPRNVLPDSIRKFDIKLDKSVLGTKRLFGRYTAKLHLNYGQNGSKTLDTTLTFWIIPWKLIASIIVGLIILFFLLRWLLKGYKRRIISQAQGSNSASAPKTTKRSRSDKK